MTRPLRQSRPSRQRRGAYAAPVATLPFWFLLVAAAILAATAWSFLWLGRTLAPGADLPEDQLRILARAYDKIDKNYIYDLTPERRAELMHAAVAGMLRSLDRYSRYYPPATGEQFNLDTRGMLHGIGVVVATVKDRPVVLYPFPKGPAETAGILVGDVITHVDGKAVHSNDEALPLIKGERDTKVALTVQQDGDEPRVVQVSRDEVVVPSLKWARILDREAGLGYVYLEKFTDNSVTEFDVAIQMLELEVGRGRLRGIVFDLRQNRGGLLDPALELTNRFVRAGTLVTLRRRNEPSEVHAADPAKCTQPELPLVVLIDGGSASSSEVLAGALQDHGRATIVGTRSFGKGVVQSIYSWVDRQERVKITTSYYLTPNGRNIENVLRPAEEQGHGGIVPEVEVDFTNGELRSKVQQRLEAREVPAKYRDAVAAFCAESGVETGDRPFGPDTDVQLAAALAALRALATGAPEREPEPHSLPK